MKIIQVQNQSIFENYDHQVQQGTLFTHDSGKNKPLVRQDSSGKSYKVYQSDINLTGRVGRFAAVGLSSLIVMPLWSKGCRRLWNEASTGKEKIKVIAAEKQAELISPEQKEALVTEKITEAVISVDEEKSVETPRKHKKVNLVNQIKIEEAPDLPDTERKRLIKLIRTCVQRLLDTSTDDTPTSLSIYVSVTKFTKWFQPEVKCDKQFIFKSDNENSFNISDITQRIQNYINNDFFKGENLRMANSLSCEVMGISLNKRVEIPKKCTILDDSKIIHPIRAWNNSITHYYSIYSEKWNSGDCSVEKQRCALSHAKIWFKYNLPTVKSAMENGEFIELEGIYQPL